ncbi:MAG: tetratricopeptide repeat protein [Mediterranea massiliensis]|nr:tetratricopeptide repeat protein [Mediterranea massiliensis]
MKKYILILLFTIIGLPLSAQSLAQGKAYYDKGEYEKAKPIYKKFVKSQPNNGSYNLHYGVCLLQTGEAEASIKYLETAVKRRTTSGQLWLGKAYAATYRFEESIETFEEYISELEKRKRSTEEAEELLEKSQNGLRMLKGVEKICVIDSVVVDKANFLEAYHISAESGSLHMYNDYFEGNATNDGIVYQTEMGNKIYYSEQLNDSTTSIFFSDKLLDDWSKGTPLSSTINSGQHVNYPYVLTDGVTIYYASTGNNSMGGYDIFVTRYNPSSGNYLAPDNLGMPFNSPYNDYMLALDEYANLGWFASDRYQPEGKVCIYIFIPNDIKEVYDYDNTDADELRRLARLTAISDSWKDEDALNNAKQRLQVVRSMERGTDETKEPEFFFIINDQLTYHHPNDFQSPQAKELFRQYCQLELDYLRMDEKLEQLRMQYGEGNQTKKDQLAPTILDLENYIFKLKEQVDQTAKEVRKHEIETLY